MGGIVRRSFFCGRERYLFIGGEIGVVMFVYFYVLKVRYVRFFNANLCFLIVLCYYLSDGVGGLGKIGNIYLYVVYFRVE